MRYSYEFKLFCVDMYKSGKYPDTPNDTTEERFKKNVREWARMVEANGPEVLKHKAFNRVWTPEEKLELVSQVISGKSRTDIALKAGI
ncbi:MAG: helix-turn-helix domain-containing protein, partial [Butyrivibrio sp.]|nr:helix-turn-helix domain-containing protein [Butyrivibrio sp.]